MNNFGFDKNIPKSIRAINTIILANEAIIRGIKIVHINSYQKDMAFLELSYKNHTEYIRGQLISKVTATAYYALKNKALTKSLLCRNNISVSTGKLFYKEDDIKKIYRFANELKYPVVIKKFDGSLGDQIFVGIKNKKICEQAIKDIFRNNEYLLIEKEFKGREYRFVVSRNKVFAIATREPANIVGTGKDTINNLIKIKNSNPLRGEEHEKPLTKIKIDDIVRNNLIEQGLQLNSIIPMNKKVYLRNNTNLSTGGESVDVTDEAHQEFKKIAIRAVRSIPGLPYAGIDLITNININEKPEKNNYAIIEMNSAPMPRMHHFPSAGKSRNVAKEIIDILFPETKGKYIEK